MKTLRPSVVLALVAASHAHAQFSPAQRLGAVADGLPAFELVDLDGDGDQDLVATEFSRDSVAWYERLSVDAFGPRQALPGTVDGPVDLVSADVDGDGDLDLAVASTGDARVSILENLGAGAFDLPRTVLSSPDVRSVFADDLDGDGDPDLLVWVAAAGQHSVEALENLGGGTFGPPQQAAADPLFSIVAVDDIDSDGDPDLLTTDGANRLFVHANSGGTFGVGQMPLPAPIAVFHLVTADVDSDQDVDLVLRTSAGVEVSTRRADGTYSAPQVALPSAAFFGLVDAADFDGDGDVDLLVSVVATAVDTNLALVPNTGGGAFDDRPRGVPFTPATLGVLIDDFDGDGDPDLVTGFGSDFVWHENIIDPDFGETEIVLPTPGIYGFDLADVNGDLAVDVVAVDGAQDLVWLEQQANGGFASNTIERVGIVRGVFAADLDLDGDADVTVALGFPGREVLVFENLGAGSFGPRQAFAVDGLSTDTFEVGDVDGDGDPDLIFGNVDCAFPSAMVWLENDGAGRFPTSRSLYAHPSGYDYRVNALDVGDADGDGDLDVLASVRSCGIAPIGLAYFENRGAGVFGPPVQIDGQWASGDVAFADVDGDGDLDAAAAFSSVLAQAPGVFWYLNDGAGSFGPRTMVTRWIDDVRQMDAADLDGDGWTDLVHVSRLEGEVAWSRNVGGAFEQLASIGAESFGLWHVEVADSDRDGDLDVFSASASIFGPGIFRYENLHVLGDVYCDGATNSTGVGATLDATGSLVASLDRMTLRSDHLPTNAAGFYLTSRAQGFASRPGGSQGDLCLGGSIGRYVGPGQVLDSGADGSFSLDLDLTRMPTPTGAVQAQAGETWNFQAWYRDVNPTSTSNFTDAVAVMLR